MENKLEDVISSAPKKTRDKAIDLLRQNPKLSATALAAEIGIQPKASTDTSTT